MRESDVAGVPATAKKHAISEQTLYLGRKKFGTLEASDVKRLKQVEIDSGRLKKVVAERDLELEVMKKINAKNGERTGAQIAGGVRESSRDFGAAGVCADRDGQIDDGVRTEDAGEGWTRSDGDEGTVEPISPVWVPSHPRPLGPPPA